MLSQLRYKKCRARKMSKSLVALRAGTLQILVAQINLTSPNKIKTINVNQKHFQYTNQLISRKEFYFTIYVVSAE